MSEKLMLKCPACNSSLKLSQWYTGCDWLCEAGEGSNYGHEISLECTNDRCAYVFTIGHVRGINDFSTVINKSFK